MRRAAKRTTLYVLQRQLADLGVQFLEVDRRFCGTAFTAKDRRRALLQLRLSGGDLVGVDIELLRQPSFRHHDPPGG